MKKPISLATGVALAALVGLVGFASPALADQPPPLTPAELELIASDTPKIVTVDATTGEFTGVEAADVLVAPMGVVLNNCSGGRACWYGYYTPDAYYGFDGSGASGTWTSRGDFYSANYSARICWQLYPGGGSTICSGGYVGHNTWITLGVRVIGKQVLLLP